VELPFREERIDDRSRVVHPEERLDGQPSGLPVDGDDGDDRAEAPDFALWVEIRRRLQPWGFPGWEGGSARIGRGCDFLPRHPPLGHADHLKAARHAGHVGRRRFEQFGRDAAAFVRNLGRHPCQGAAAERHAAAAEGAEALGAAARVAMDHDDVVRRHPEVVGHNLGEGGLVPLAMGALPGDGRHAPRALDLQAAALPAERARLHIGGEPDADDLSATAPLFLGAAEPA
jgi:hypothetical protein